MEHGIISRTLTHTHTHTHTQTHTHTLTHTHFFLPLALKPYVGFGFRNQVISNLPIQRQFFPIIHIHHLHIVTHIIQPSNSWSSYQSAHHSSF